METTKTVNDQLYKTLMERMADPRSVWGIPWGFRDLDALTGGIHKGELSILGARPKMGKTAILGQIARSAAEWALGNAKEGSVVRLVMCESSPLVFQQRLLCAIANLSSRRVREGSITAQERERYIAAQKELSYLPIEYLDHPTSLDATRKFIERDGKCVWWAVDYLQIHPLGRDTDNSTFAVTKLSNGFRELARDVAPGLALSQLSRKLEDPARKDKTPMASDFRDSGAIEQDAALLLALHRPDMYSRVDDLERDIPKAAELHVIYHRNGDAGVIPLWWVPTQVRFADNIRPETL